MTDARNPGIIRPIRDDDQPRVHQIAVAGWQPVFARYRLIAGERMWRDLWGGWEEGWFAHSTKGIATEVDGEVVGFATWWYPSEHLPEVGGNAVDPRFQGRGIGTAQIRWVIEMFRREGHQYAKVLTGLDPAHGPARAEYRNAGLRLGVTSSRYYNYLDEVARIPLPQALRFRWAEPDDTEEIGQLARRGWQDLYAPVCQTLGDGLFTAAFGDAIQQKVEKLAEIVSTTSDRLRVATQAEQVIGFAVLDVDEEKKLGTIETLSVHPESRNRGMGAAMCMDAFAFFEERDLRYAQLTAKLGEVNERTRRLCWNVGLHRELPSIDYHMYL